MNDIIWDKLTWEKNFISFENNEYIAWDETQAYEIGRTKTLKGAVKLLLVYGLTLNHREGEWFLYYGSNTRNNLRA
jgi:hypothetical protein